MNKPPAVSPPPPPPSGGNIKPAPHDDGGSIQSYTSYPPILTIPTVQQNRQFVVSLYVARVCNFFFRTLLTCRGGVSRLGVSDTTSDADRFPTSRVSIMFSIVTGFELHPVHNPRELFAACRQAGIKRRESMLGMASRLEDRVLCVWSEVEKRIPKVRKTLAAKTLVRKASPERILWLANAYAAIPAAFDDSLESNYSPLDD